MGTFNLQGVPRPKTCIVYDFIPCYTMLRQRTPRTQLGEKVRMDTVPSLVEAGGKRELVGCSSGLGILDKSSGPQPIRPILCQVSSLDNVFNGQSHLKRTSLRYLSCGTAQYAVDARSHTARSTVLARYAPAPIPE